MMNLGAVKTGIAFVGTTIKNLMIDNSIVTLRPDATKEFCLNINEPTFKKNGDVFFSTISIDFEIELVHSETEKCKIEMSLEGAFSSMPGIEEEPFKKLVIYNGAAALIGIARGKIEAITANVFHDGKVTIPFVNVLDYYNSLSNRE